MYKKILVPLDGSETAEAVLPYVEEVAARVNAEVMLAGVSKPGDLAVSNLYRAYLKHVQELLQHGLRRYKIDSTRIESDILIGEPADEILRYSEKSGADLIAMTSRGLSEGKTWVLGSVVTKVLRAATIPILLVRTSASKGTVQRRRLIRTILLPLDGSEPGKSAIPHAEALALALGARLILFHVLEPITGWAGASPAPSSSREEGQRRRKSLALEHLKEIGKPLEEKGLKVSKAVASGSPAEQIVGYAKAKSVDLIAMSTWGRSGIARWMLGSVTDKTLHAGDTPVLVIQAAARK